MDPAYYVAAGSLKARSYQLETLSNNLANAMTVGYKSERTFFSVFNKARSEGRGLPLTGVVNDGTVLANRGVDFSQGPNKPTGRNLDFAIEGNGFFVLQTPQGQQLTRDGRFQLDAQGTLLSMDGLPVLGKNGLPLRVDRTKGDLSTAPDGTLQQGGQTVGQLQLKAYDDPRGLSRVGANRYAAGQTREGAVKATVAQGYLEQSTVDTASVMVDMIQLNRLYEMSLKVASALSNDLDARTINDVANGR